MALVLLLGLALGQGGRFEERAWAARALWLRGEELSLQGRWEEALRFYWSALRFDPGYVEAHLGAGLVLMAMGWGGMARGHLEAFVERGWGRLGWDWAVFLLAGMGSRRVWEMPGLGVR